MNSQLTAISEGLSLRFPVQTGRVGGGGGGAESVHTIFKPHGRMNH